ncbi:phosphoglycerate dehydrogenase-like enzyme [Bradyrhizobium sp. i1.3.1]
MNTPRVENQRASTSVRSPIIVNQLGPDIRAALVDHWSRPLIIDHSADRAPWEVAPEADVLLTRPLVGWHKAPAEKPAGWPFGLHWIQTASTGVDFFPAWLLDGPVVTVGRGISADPIAEYVLAAILGFEKRIHDIRPSSREQWKISPLGSLTGKTIGIAGFGAIGRAVAERAKPFGVNIRVLRRSAWPYVLPGIQPVDSIEELVAVSDHLVLALPATTKTARLINADVLARAKTSLHLINVARGRIVDQSALLQALDEGRDCRRDARRHRSRAAAGGRSDLSPSQGRPDPACVMDGWRGCQRLADKTLVNLDAYAHGVALADVFDKNLEY